MKENAYEIRENIKGENTSYSFHTKIKNKKGEKMTTEFDQRNYKNKCVRTKGKLCKI